jgi:hypothetical protein
MKKNRLVKSSLKVYLEYLANNKRLWAALAQLVEHRIRNAGVGCSNHPSGTIVL